MHSHEEPDSEDQLALFVGVRNMFLFYAAIAIGWLLATYAIGQEQTRCEHPIDMQRIELEEDGFGLWIQGEEIICDVCGKRRSVRLPGVTYSNAHKPEVREQIAQHERYVSQVRDAIKARREAGLETRSKTMNHGVQYSHPDRKSPTGSKDYLGATSRGAGWEIRWQGPYNAGPTAIDTLRAARDHLTHLQKTTAASESNAKLLVHVIQAIEEFDGVPPTIGGSLNDLIPKE